jgi:pyrimidine deaminase RibD-like protein
MTAAPASVPVDLAGVPPAVHERFMRLAIAKARENPAYPFGAVIIRATDLTVMASGVNTTRRNPTFHGEMDAINDYVRQHGNQGWGGLILYTTGEPCPISRRSWPLSARAKPQEWRSVCGCTRDRPARSAAVAMR